MSVLSTETGVNGNYPVNDPDPSENSVDLAGSERLQEAVNGAGGPSEVARRSGVPLGTLKNYLRGRDMKRTALVALADACNVTVEWLAAGRGDMHVRHEVAIAMHAQGSEDRMLIASDAQSVPYGYVAIPRYNVVASAGAGADVVAYSQVVEYLAFEEEYLRTRLRRRPDQLSLIEARGDSMEPTIHDGDVLTVDISPGQALESGSLYVLRVEDALLVKRLEVRLTGLMLHSDNPRYAPEPISRADTEQLHILGQVLLVTAPPR